MYIAAPPSQLELLREVQMMVRKEIPDFRIVLQDSLLNYLHEKLENSGCSRAKVEYLVFEILSLAEMEICYQVFHDFS